ncbi:MAG: DNA recombination protein RmuC [Bacteroidales bacterium]|nr:DNA recombination protein RmuC [Bacteroidales bacterium]
MEIITIVLCTIILFLLFLLFFSLTKNKNKQSAADISHSIQHLETLLREEFKNNRDEVRSFNRENREELASSIAYFRASFDQSINSFNTLQKEKFSELDLKQRLLIENTERKLEEIRSMVDEKLQKTLNERLGQSFKLVSSQLESVQKGLGEMQNLAQDVGGLKRVLANVKTRGNIGEIQLGFLLDQILAPEQYVSNVKLVPGSNDFVEFAIKLPGNDDTGCPVYLPIDAKFPKDIYEQYLDAIDNGSTENIEKTAKLMEITIRKMAKDIHDKYISPPATTDFAILFLPFESLYADVIRRSALLEELMRIYKIVVTGPTTLAAILNSLQMGFRTLAIQKRTGEVWNVLNAVKKEFDKFGGMLEKAQKNLQTASNQLDEVMGKRTKAIQRSLRRIERDLPEGNSSVFSDLLSLENDNEFEDKNDDDS